MEAQAKTAGLRYRNGLPMWRASKAAIRSGYPVKYVNLASLAHDERLVVLRSQRLQAEMLAWLSGKRSNAPVFDGTIGSLLDVYQTDPESPYRKLKASSRHPYDVYARMLKVEVGKRRIDAIDGRDLKRWFTEWSTPDKPDGKPTIAAARMAISVLKTAVTFGKICRMAGCQELRLILNDMQFPSLRPRTEAPTAEQIVRARAEAHKAGHPLAALAFALQFEATLRQWDVIGQWFDLSDPRPSAVLNGNKKWIGPTWANIDSNLVLRVTPSKTQATSGARVAIDLRGCPMVMEELTGVPLESRIGPLVTSPRTGLPYTSPDFRGVWKASAGAAGIPPTIWNRDLRAGAVTEARQSGAPTDDVAKVAGHSDKRTTADVYDRDRLEAARRVAKARVAFRGKNEG